MAPKKKAVSDKEEKLSPVKRKPASPTKEKSKLQAKKKPLALASDGKATEKKKPIPLATEKHKADMTAFYRGKNAPAWKLSEAVVGLNDNKFIPSDPFWISLGSLNQIYADLLLPKPKTECSVPEPVSTFDMPCSLTSATTTLRLDQLRHKFNNVMIGLRAWQNALEHWRIQEDRVITCWVKNGKRGPCIKLLSEDADFPDFKLSSEQRASLVKFVAVEPIIVQTRATVDKHVAAITNDVQKLKSEIVVTRKHTTVGWLDTHVVNLGEFVYAYMELLQADERVADASHLLHAYGKPISVSSDVVKKRVTLPLYNQNTTLLPGEKTRVLDALKDDDESKTAWNDHLAKQRDHEKMAIQRDALETRAAHKLNLKKSPQQEVVGRRHLTNWMCYQLLTQKLETERQELEEEKGFVVEDDEEFDNETEEKQSICDFSAAVTSATKFQHILANISEEAYPYAFGFEQGTLLESLHKILPAKVVAKDLDWKDNAKLKKVHALRNGFFDWVTPDTAEENGSYAISKTDQFKRETHLRQLIELGRRELDQFNLTDNLETVWHKEIWSLALQDAILFFKGGNRIEFSDIANLENCWKRYLLHHGLDDPTSKAFYKTINAFLLALNQVLSLTIERVQIRIDDVDTPQFSNDLVSSIIYLTTAYNLWQKNPLVTNQYHWVQTIDRARRANPAHWREDVSWVPVNTEDQRRYWEATLKHSDEFKLDARRFALIDFGLTIPVTYLWQLKLGNVFQVARLQTDLVRQRLYPKELRVALQVLNKEKGKAFDRPYLDFMATADYDHLFLPQALAHNASPLFPFLEAKETWAMNYSIKPSLVKRYIGTLDSKLITYRRENPIVEKDEDKFDEEEEEKRLDAFIKNPIVGKKHLPALKERVEELEALIANEQDEDTIERYEKMLNRVELAIQRLERGNTHRSEYADLEAEEGEEEEETNDAIVGIQGSIADLEEQLNSFEEDEEDQREALQAELDALLEELHELEDEALDEEEQKDRNRVRITEYDKEQEALDAEIEAEANEMNKADAEALRELEEENNQVEEARMPKYAGIGWNRFLSRPL